MKKIELEIIAIQQSITHANSYAVILGEVNGSHRLPIIIGGCEAQAIAVSLERMSPSRPLTHDLMKNFMTSFGIELHEIIIHDLQEGVFFSKLICSNERDTLEIDSRTSDAVAMAVRFGCPIYIVDHILESAGILMEETPASAKKKKDIADPLSASIETPANEELIKLNLDELHVLLNEVLEKEDYIKAIAIRDEINSRKTNRDS